MPDPSLPTGTVTLETLIEEKPYTPKPGTAYELAEGVVATLRFPTVALTREVEALRKSAVEAQTKGDALGAGPDITLALLVTKHGEIQEDDVIPPVATQIVLDFFGCMTTTLRKLPASVVASEAPLEALPERA